MLETLSTKNKLRMMTEGGLKVEADVTKNANGITVEGGTVYDNGGVWHGNFHNNSGNWHFDFSPQSTRAERMKTMTAAEDFIAEASE